MSTDQSGARGADENARGELETDPKDKDGNVPYEKYRAVLSEKKKTTEKLGELQTRLQELEQKEKDREDAAMREKEDFKGLLTQREKELEAERKEKTALRESVQNSEKMATFLSQVNGDVPEQYWGLVDLSKIHIDPNTTRVDEASAQKYAREFEKVFGLVLQKKGGGTLPGDAPKGGGKLSYDEWLKLPLKDQKARLKDVAG
jgi:hypothetical protein